MEVRLRDKRDRASAAAFFRQALTRTDVPPSAVLPDHHQPYVKAVAAIIPLARQVRPGVHGRCGYTTHPVERSHVPTRARLRGGGGRRTVHPGQRFWESFEAFHALRRGTGKRRAFVPRSRLPKAAEHEEARTVLAALAVLGPQLRKAA